MKWYPQGLADEYPRYIPQLAFHTAAVRELEIEVTYRYQDVVPGQTLISNAAQSLERLVLRFDDTWTAPVLPLPPLPALRRLELLFTLRDFSLQWLLDTVRTFLASTSDMLEIIVTFELVSLGPEPLPMAPNKDLFAAFDRVLKSLANSTLLVWRFPTTGEYDSPVREFSTWVRESMPTVDSRGSLVFERYIPSLQGEQLVIGPRWEMQSSSSSQRTRILL
ncbi:hypothetical protein DFH06DRAFT_1374171 [Mycena polygramma]|nr:hypothetical protein DFH06DRAFT_1374171 [Mycena polygramma]